jgi:hypothetical protein
MQRCTKAADTVPGVPYTHGLAYVGISTVEFKDGYYNLVVRAASLAA